MISGHSYIFISFMLSLMYCGVDNPIRCGYARLCDMASFYVLCLLSCVVYIYWRVMDGLWVECLHVVNKVGDCGLS